MTHFIDNNLAYQILRKVPFRERIATSRALAAFDPSLHQPCQDIVDEVIYSRMLWREDLAWCNMVNVVTIDGFGPYPANWNCIAMHRLTGDILPHTGYGDEFVAVNLVVTNHPDEHEAPITPQLLVKNTIGPLYSIPTWFRYARANIIDGFQLSFSLESHSIEAEMVCEGKLHITHAAPRHRLAHDNNPNAQWFHIQLEASIFKEDYIEGDFHGYTYIERSLDLHTTGTTVIWLAWNPESDSRKFFSNSGMHLDRQSYSLDIPFQSPLMDLDTDYFVIDPMGETWVWDEGGRCLHRPAKYAFDDFMDHRLSIPISSLERFLFPRPS